VNECIECGYVYSVLTRSEISSSLRDHGQRYAEVLGEIDDRVLRAHPLPATWSILEYACHVRDILRVQDERVNLALVEETPHFASMRREERVTEERYNEQDPRAVAEEVIEGAEALASTFEGLDEEAWARTGIYNWPQTAERTIEWIGRHTIHECHHHLLDIERLKTAIEDPPGG
jgi:hypothetical protein